MLEFDIPVRTDLFDGPFDLLLHLIQKDQVSVRDIDVQKITQKYLDYLSKMQELNFNIAGDYLYMAANLIYLKSKACLDEESDSAKLLNEADLGENAIVSREQLIARLEELSRFQTLGDKLWNLPKLNVDVFCRPRIDRNKFMSTFVSQISINELTEVMIDFLKRENRKFAIVKRDRLSIKEKLIDLKQRLRVGAKVTLDDILDVAKLATEDKAVHRDDVVISFICILELARLGKIDVFQNELFGPIYVEVIDSLDNFDVDLANGFEVTPGAPIENQIEMQKEQ